MSTYELRGYMEYLYIYKLNCQNAKPLKWTSEVKKALKMLQ